MSEIIPIDFPKNENWLDGNPLPTGSDGWRGLEKIMPALVERFCKKREWALEFGVEYGYSTSILAQLFRDVEGVDWFKGDEHSNWREDYYVTAAANLANWKNVHLIRTNYQEWIAKSPKDLCFDLIHVDMSHDYYTTYTAGRWAVDHSPVVIFHDSESFPMVKQAVLVLSDETGRTFYNYRECNGLAILVKE